MAEKIPTEQEVFNYFKTLSNWGRWGTEDELGTLNFITAKKTQEAAGLIREGIKISCSRPIVTDIRPDMASGALRYMIDTGEGRSSGDATRSPFALEFIGMVFHGKSITHIDSLSHCFFGGKMYNGREAKLVASRTGAGANSVEALKEGVVTRGVLLDVAKGSAVFPEDLEAAEKRQGVRVGSGDVLLVRNGGPLHVASAPWLFEREVAMLGSDSDNEIIPSGYKNISHPFHMVLLAAMGLWIIDNMELKELAASCRKHNRWEFSFLLAPLRLQDTTGSPVNPLAVF